MKRGILIFLALSAALAIAWPNGAKETAPKEERERASRQSAPLVYSYQRDKPVYTVKVPPPAPSAPPSVAQAVTPQASPAAQSTPNPKPLDPADRVKQTDFKESNPTFASYGCATMAVLGTVQTLTGTQFTKPQVEKIIEKNKENEGFKNDDYTVIWKTTFDTALAATGSKSKCVGIVKLDPTGEAIYSDIPKDMNGVVSSSSGPVRGVSTGHFVEAGLPGGSKLIYNPGNTEISNEKKEVIIPLIKVNDIPTWDWAADN